MTPEARAAEAFRHIYSCERFHSDQEHAVLADEIREAEQEARAPLEAEVADLKARLAAWREWFAGSDSCRVNRDTQGNDAMRALIRLKEPGWSIPDPKPQESP